MIDEEEYYKPHVCPVCGKYDFPTHGSYEICEVCGWQDDYLQENESEDTGGANWEGLAGYRALYEAGKLDATDEEKAAWLKENGFFEE